MGSVIEKHPALIIHSQVPFNAEPPLDLLRENFITPRALFYVRNHGNIPQVDAEKYRLTVSGLVERELELSLDRLRNDFPKRTVMATLQCAGNRRSELIAIAPTPGETPWREGAIGNAFWSGVPLREVLNAAGVKVGAQFVAMAGLDDVLRGGQNVGFGGSIPIEKAMGSDVLLAYEMNGEELALEHGFPLRVVTPGYVGARSVKWLASITLQPVPSANYFQAHAYQLFSPHTNADTADWTSGLQLGGLAVNSAICAPADGARVSGNEVVVEGYAISGGGRRIARLDVSTDEGATWTTARITHGDQSWAWNFWQARLTLPPGEHTLVARAFDDATNTQPEDAGKIWNFKGYMNNAWHRVKIICDK